VKAGPVLLLVPLLAGCIDRLPDHDLRIHAAVPVAKLSADILWKEYASDRSAADRAYWGKPIVVTGVVSNSGTATTDRFVFFGQDKDFGVRATPLDEQAESILEQASKEPRITVKCFCEGLSGNVILKSCVKP
jgi:hypothetical protein